MKKIITLIYLFFAACTTLCAQNNVITYTASAKLEEVTDWYFDGLYADAFGVSILSHDFSGTTGTITFSGDVTRIGNYAFSGCSGLTSVTIPSSVTSIGGSAFSGCSGLTSIDIPNSVTSIGNDAFFDCSGLTSITIPESVTSIGGGAFEGCSRLTSITIPSSVTSIGSSAFGWCSGLTSIDIPNSVTSIGDYAFCRCSSLTSIVVESGNLKYDSRNNSNAIIETTTNTLIIGCMNSSIPNSVTSIGNYAFYGCSGLTSITIPNSVTSIGDYAFYRCSGLTSITCHAEVPPFCGGNVFESVTRTIPLYVPASSIPLYQAAEQWNEFDIQPLLVTTDSVATDTTQLSWMPVDSASMYQLRIYSEQIGLDTTLYIAADSLNGGIRIPLSTTSQRAHRMTMDAGGSVIIITIEPNSGATTTTPFVVTVSTPSTEKIDIQFEMTVLQGTNILREESGSFTLNTDNLTGLESVFYPTPFDSQRCYDIYGHSYPQTLWNNLPAGIYVIHNGGKVVKIMK